MIVFTEDSHRDLKREAGAAAGKKEAGASERRVPLARLLPNESTAEARPAGTGKKMEDATAAEKKMKEVVASESEDEAVAALKKKMKKKGYSLFKEGEMLKLRKELWEAEHLWRMKDVPGALDGFLKRKTTTHQVPAAIAAKMKKKKVVRVMSFSDGYIDYIKANPGMTRELSDQEMAECPERFRQSYMISKFVNAKNRAYKQAIIDQYQAFGFAYDEDEVTDDDEKEERSQMMTKRMRRWRRRRR